MIFGVGLKLYAYVLYKHHERIII